MKKMEVLGEYDLKRQSWALGHAFFVCVKVLHFANYTVSPRMEQIVASYGSWEFKELLCELPQFWLMFVLLLSGQKSYVKGKPCW
jgi:hypothetical protein